jgi:hypothetical protein
MEAMREFIKQIDEKNPENHVVKKIPNDSFSTEQKPYPLERAILDLPDMKTKKKASLES